MRTSAQENALTRHLIFIQGNTYVATTVATKDNVRSDAAEGGDISRCDMN